MKAEEMDTINFDYEFEIAENNSEHLGKFIEIMSLNISITHLRLSPPSTDLFIKAFPSTKIS